MTKPKQPRTTIRWTPEEHALIAAKAGGQAIAGFVREATLAEAATRRQPQRKPGVEAVSAAQILALLGSHPVVTDFKVAAKTSSRDDKVDACYALLAEVRELLMQSLGKRS